jgi:L,D-transpeptidase YcbB
MLTAPQPQSKITEPRALFSGVVDEGLMDAPHKNMAPLHSRPVVSKSTPPSAQTSKARGRAYVSESSDPSFDPETAQRTAQAAERYQAIAAQGGWPTVPALTLKMGAQGAAVDALRTRLTLSGDLNEVASGVTPALFEAVKLFQMRHGLNPTGVFTPATRTALNVSAQARAMQLARSAARLNESRFPFGERYVVVNIPSASVEAIENGSVARRFVAVVGKPDRPSPIVETRITAVNLNPTWTVPPSILKKDVIPAMQKDPSYLARKKIRVLNSRGEEIDPYALDWGTERMGNFILRQDPGAGNALGSVRIDMPNTESVYMHDTPTQSLFGSEFRFHSSGCVRVADVKDLAQWLLQGTPRGAGEWTVAGMDSVIRSTKRQDIRLTNPVPVAWVYSTGYATRDGLVHFRPDVYDIDRAH